MSEIRVFIADDHNLVREGIRSLIEAADSLVVAGEASRLDQVLDGVKAAKPQVVLLDVFFPAGPSFKVCEAIKEAMPEVKVIFLTGVDDKKVVNESIMSDGDGFLLKGVKFAQFVSAIRDVMAGKSVIDQSVMGDSPES